METTSPATESPTPTGSTPALSPGGNLRGGQTATLINLQAGWESFSGRTKGMLILATVVASIALPILGGLLVGAAIGVAAEKRGRAKAQQKISKPSSPPPRSPEAVRQALLLVMDKAKSGDLNEISVLQALGSPVRIPTWKVSQSGMTIGNWADNEFYVWANDPRTVGHFPSEYRSNQLNRDKLVRAFSESRKEGLIKQADGRTFLDTNKAFQALVGNLHSLLQEGIINPKNIPAIFAMANAIIQETTNMALKQAAVSAPRPAPLPPSRPAVSAAPQPIQQPQTGPIDEFTTWAQNVELQGHFKPGQARFIIDMFKNALNDPNPLVSLEGKLKRAKSQHGTLTDGNISYTLEKAGKILKKTPAVLPPTTGSRGLDIGEIARQAATGVVGFYNAQDNWATECFGNFYECKEKVLGCKTAEAAFQSQKFEDNPRDRLFDAFKDLDGDGAFKLGRTSGRWKLNSNWDSVKLDAMRKVLADKFKPGSDLAKALLATGTAYLVEHNNRAGKDNFWSDNSDGTGQNWLGRLLMEQRAKLGGTGDVNCPPDYLTKLARPGPRK